MYKSNITFNFSFWSSQFLEKNEALELFLRMWIDALIIEAVLYYRAVGQLLDDQKFCATTNRKNQVHYRMARYFPSQTPKNPLRALWLNFWCNKKICTHKSGLQCIITLISLEFCEIKGDQHNQRIQNSTTALFKYLNSFTWLLFLDGATNIKNWLLLTSHLKWIGML